MRIVAHRGYSSRYPENTRLAFEQAIAAGADLIETDLRVTRDGAVVCSHDAELSRVTGVPVVIADSTLAQVKAAPMRDGQQILTLAEVLAIAGGRVRVMLDVKIDSTALRAGALAALREAGMTDRVLYGVRSVEHLHAVRDAGPDLALIAMPAQPALLPEFLGAGVVAARLWEDAASAAEIERVRQAGLEAWITAGLRPAAEAPGAITAQRLRGLIAMGVDAVLLNDVGLALEVRRARRTNH